jgi:hypothetical protein
VAAPATRTERTGRARVLVWPLRPGPNAREGRGCWCGRWSCGGGGWSGGHGVGGMPSTAMKSSINAHTRMPPSSLSSGAASDRAIGRGAPSSSGAAAHGQSSGAAAHGQSSGAAAQGQSDVQKTQHNQQRLILLYEQYQRQMAAGGRLGADPPPAGNVATSAVSPPSWDPLTTSDRGVAQTASAASQQREASQLQPSRTAHQRTVIRGGDFGREQSSGNCRPQSHGHNPHTPPLTHPERELQELYKSPSVAAARLEAGLPPYKPPHAGIEELPWAPKKTVGRS